MVIEGSTSCYIWEYLDFLGSFSVVWRVYLFNQSPHHNTSILQVSIETAVHVAPSFWMWLHNSVVFLNAPLKFFWRNFRSWNEAQTGAYPAQRERKTPPFVRDRPECEISLLTFRHSLQHFRAFIENSLHGRHACLHLWNVVQLSLRCLCELAEKCLRC